ncbi:Beta-sarcoglycan [Aphelenchoides bicaudatus]|nr:Beta-sarcoglycan [Aphelenchoides bicaudatus]
MSSPRYLRRTESEDEYTPKKVSSVDGLRDERDEETLHVAGLREKRLIALIIWLTILGILAAVVLICNLMLISILRMSGQGMSFVRIQSYEDSKTGQKESVVYMTGERVELGHVIAKSGQVVGPKAQTMNIDGTRVCFSFVTFKVFQRFMFFLH